jgi:hypothetical protein
VHFKNTSLILIVGSSRSVRMKEQAEGCLGVCKVLECCC